MMSVSAVAPSRPCGGYRDVDQLGGVLPAFREDANEKGALQPNRVQDAAVACAGRGEDEFSFKSNDRLKLDRIDRHTPSKTRETIVRQLLLASN